MKYRIVILLFFTLKMFSTNISKGFPDDINSLLLPPSATISGGTTVCQNATSPLITFTGTGGTAPYTFTYTINGGANQTIQTTGSNSTITLPVSTINAGTFNYTLVSVTDNATPPETVNVSGSTTVNVNPQPNANMGGTGSGSTFGGYPVFRVCTNAAAQFSFTNTSTSTAQNTNYTIDWGDGSTDFTASTWTTLSHTYQVGLWYLNYTITGSNGCSITRTFIVFVGSNPAVSLGNPGNTDICSANSLTFPITGTSNNPPGTTYTVTFNDGSTPLVFNHPPPSSVSHTFTTSSCGTTSSDGSNTYPNSFSANIVANNPCSTSSVGVVPIYVSQNPIANFTSPPTACLNSQICLTNTSQGNQVISNNCSSPTIVWSITPNTGFTVVGSSSLGNDFGSTDPNLWLPGSDSLCLIFNVAGTYSVTIKTGNKCDVDIETKTICVQPALTPSFTLNTTTGCTPLAITATNTTNFANQCTTPTSVWSVSYTAANCGTSITPIPNQTSQNATYNFTEPGNYTITLTTTNSCGSTSTSQTVSVKKPPTASIASIANTCGTATINPTATINACAPPSSTLTYAWSFPGGIPASANTPNPGSISYATPGTYTVSLIVTNECGPSNVATQNFTINDAPVVTNTNLSQTICSGTPTTAVNLTANLVGTTFTWSATATTGITGFIASGSTNTIPVQTITTSNTNPGTVTYTITPSLNNCSGTPVTYTINITPAPTISTQPTSSTVCLNGNPTTMNVALSSGSSSAGYQWYSNTTNSTSGGTLLTNETNPIFNPPATTVGTIYYYCVINTSSSGCSNLTSNVASVTVNPQPTITTQPLPSQSLCVGGSPSALSLSYTGGVGTPTYQWYSNNTNSNTGGTPIAAATNSSYTPPSFAIAGTYYLYAIITLSGNGCTTVTSNVVEIQVFDDPTLNTQPLQSQILCQGATPTPLSVAAVGGNGTFAYQWYSNANNNATSGIPISGATASTYTPPTNTVGTVYYYCVISQSTLGCSVTSTTAAVTVNTSPSITNQPASSTVCLGGTPTTLSFTFANGQGTASYQWYSNTANNTTSGTPINLETNPTYTPPTNTIGTVYYYCQITFSGITGACATIATNPTPITVTPAATIQQQPTPAQSICVGASLPTPLTVSYTDGTGTPTYQWFFNTTNSNSGGTAISGANSTSYNPPAFSVTGSFYYYVEITFSGSGCGNTVSNVAEVIVAPDPVVTTQPLSNQSLCQNELASLLSVAVSGGVGTSYSYQWFVSNTNNTTSGTAITGGTNSTYAPTTSNTGILYYYCIISQPNGPDCTVTSAVATVTVNSAPTIGSQPASSTVCFGELPTTLSFTINNGVGTPTYQWFSNATNSNTGGTAINSETNPTYVPPSNTVGNFYYYCVVTFPDIVGSCSVITTNPVEVIVNPVPFISSISDVICSGTTFTVIPSNSGSNSIPTGTNYTWSQPVINPVGAITGAVAETIPQTQIAQTLTNTTNSPATATYTVTPTSGNCPGNNFTITVTVNPAINANPTVTNSTCFGSNNASITTNIVGGIPFATGVPYIISWTGPNGFTANTPSLSNIAPGDYDLTVTDDGGCPFSATYTITEPNAIAISIDNESDVTCFGAANGSIAISTSGGTGNYNYSWTKDNAPFSSNEDLTNLSPGTYEVSVTDANNCGPITASFTITQPTVLAVSLSNQVNINCFGEATGSITVQPSGGTPIEITSGVFDYNYQWSGPNGFTSTNQNITNLQAGNYTIVVTDNLGCQANLSVTLSQPSEIVITATTTPIVCYGDNNASITVSISGGTPPYQTAWSNLAVGLNQSNLSAGDYTLTVTDGIGCTEQLTINIPEAPLFAINPVVTNISCFGAQDGSIVLNFVGGIAPVNLVWSDGSTAGTTRNNLGPGTYSVTITDSKPCTITGTFTILEPQLLVVAANTINALDCNNANSGSINLLVSGGTPPFSYNWSNGAITEDLNNLSAGNYLVTVTDSRGCTKQAEYSITRPAPMVVNVTTTTNPNCPLFTINQTFDAQVTGGVPPFQFNWSSGTVSGTNNQTMTTNQSGLVILNIVDALGCSPPDYTFNVQIPTYSNSDFEFSSIGYTSLGIVSILDPIQFTTTATGPFETILWDFGDGTFSNEVNPSHTYLIEGSYVVTQTITYPFGCTYTNVLTLDVTKGYLLVVPNAFTPNEDAINNTFRPVTKALQEVRLDVYDTWGSLIYSETGDVLVGWDGTIKGIQAENGNYYCKVSAKTFYGLTVNENHPFVLIK